MSFGGGFYFENHTRTQAPTVSLRGSGQIYTRGPKGRVVVVLTGGDILPFSIFLIFKYDNKQNALILKKCLKVASAFYIRSYEHFKFQI